MITEIPAHHGGTVLADRYYFLGPSIVGCGDPDGDESPRRGPEGADHHMAGRHAVVSVLAGIAAATLAAGCTAAITGSPRAATTRQASSTVSTPAVPSGPVTPSVPTTPSGDARSSAIRPMPPLTGTGPASDSAGATPTSAGAPAGTETIAGVALAPVLADLAASHVAGVNSTADLAKLATLVDGARSRGLELSVVSIGRKISDSDTSAISDALFASTGGTLLVLSPSLVSARSDQLTDQQRNNAIRAAADGNTDEQSVSKFIDAALTGAVTSTSTAPATTSTATKVGKVGGIDVDAVVSALGPDHIAIGAGVTQVTAKDLAPTVQKAWKAGLELSVAVLAKDASGHLYDVAAAVMGRTGGTVITVSPSMYAIASKQLSDKQLNDALDAGADATSYAALVKDMVASLLG